MTFASQILEVMGVSKSLLNPLEKFMFL